MLPEGFAVPSRAVEDIKLHRGIAAVISVLVRSVALQKNAPRCIAVRSSTVQDIKLQRTSPPERHGH